MRRVVLLTCALGLLWPAAAFAQSTDERVIPDDPALLVADADSQARGESLQWWAVREHFPEAWALADGDSVTVAVIDRDVDVTHPDLVAKIGRTLDYRRRGARAPGRDRKGHGTHVASLACAQPDNGVGLAGAGYGCRLIVVRSDLSDSSLARSIIGATKAGAGVISMSLGTDDRRNAPRAIRDAVDFAYDHGVVLVAAAADRPTTEQGDPANLLQPTGTGRHLDAGKGLSVTAADFSGQRASWAGDGSQISLAAYGAFERTGPDGLLGAFPAPTARPRGESTSGGRTCGCRALLDGDDRYAFLEGTSMATPIVAGAAALVRDLNPDLGPADVIRTLKSSAQRPSGQGWNENLGWGIVDALAAVQLAARLDRRPPASRLTVPVPPTDGLVTVDVAADDVAGPPGVRVAGISAARIYAAEADGGEAELVGELDASGQARVRLVAGRTYELYSVAIDRAGNAEAPPSSPDVTITLPKTR